MDSMARTNHNQANSWRLETPGGSETWARSPYLGQAKKKYFMVSADTHLAPPATLIRDQIDRKYRDLVPYMQRDENGVLRMIVEGRQTGRIIEVEMEGEDLYRAKAGGGAGLDDGSAQVEKRIADMDLDGIDAELIFPNGTALAAFWTSDPELMQAQFRIYNDWAYQFSAPYRDRMNVAACIATGDVAGAVAEVQRVAGMGFRVITLPNKPTFGPTSSEKFNYNLPEFDPLWAAVEETDLTMTFHVSTGADPRGAKGPGGAVINFAIHGLNTTAEPVANLCVSGILDRFPRLRFATVEAGIGWVPWLLDTLDEGYRKHHMWAFPKLRNGLPSDYYREHGGSTFGEDPSGLALIEKYRLQDNFCWANDYPHHEGTFPYSAQSIERQMGDVDEGVRAKLLGLNAARLFKFELPRT